MRAIHPSSVIFWNYPYRGMQDRGPAWTQKMLSQYNCAESFWWPKLAAVTKSVCLFVSAGQHRHVDNIEVLTTLHEICFVGTGEVAWFKLWPMSLGFCSHAFEMTTALSLNSGETVSYCMIIQRMKWSLHQGYQVWTCDHTVTLTNSTRLTVSLEHADYNTFIRLFEMLQTVAQQCWNS